MRVLGRIRLSRLTDESTSAARQRELISQWSEANGHEVIGWAEDLDVSGSVDPFDTPALGPWLTPEKQDEWDIICAWKLDRFGRNSIKLNKLFGWTIDHGKTVVSCSEGIDLSTPVGRLIANVIAFLAEGELEAIRERTRASRQALLHSGRWAGGRVPYGWQAVKLPGGGWRLALKPYEAEVLRTAIMGVIAGKSVESVANEIGFTPSHMWKILVAKYLLGHSVLNGNTVRDSEGKPILNAEPIITNEEWDQLQAALKARKTGPLRTRDTAPMHGVVKCFECGGNLYHKIYRKNYGKRVYRYYHCEKGHCAQISAESVEKALEEAFLAEAADRIRRKKVFHPAENHEVELEDAKRALDETSALLGTMTSEAARSRLTEQIRAIDFRIAALEKLPTREAKWEWVNTDETWAETWHRSDTEGRRQLLLGTGITYSIIRLPGTKAIKSDLYIPDDALDLLDEKNPPQP